MAGCRSKATIPASPTHIDFETKALYRLARWRRAAVATARASVRSTAIFIPGLVKIGLRQDLLRGCGEVASGGETGQFPEIVRKFRRKKACTRNTEGSAAIRLLTPCSKWQSCRNEQTIRAEARILPLPHWRRQETTRDDMQNHSESPRRPVPFRGREELGTLPSLLSRCSANLFNISNPSPVCTWAS